MGAYREMQRHQAELAAHKTELARLNLQQDELRRKRQILDQVSDFTARATSLGLVPEAWSFYDVNVAGGFSYETARQIIEQCSESPLAYYWPISLEIGAVKPEETRPAQGQAAAAPKGDVQLAVKGQFVARQP